MTFAAQFDPKHNAITLLRLLLAILVVYGHAYELGRYGLDPAQRLFGVSLGEFGVNTFFALSGFLVTRSYLGTRDVRRYFVKRALRIFPGFWVCLLLTALVLAPALFAWSHQHALFPTGWKTDGVNYVVRNAGLKINRQGIGELFAHQPAAGTINGSLWSLFPEALCYVGVAILGGLGVFGLTRSKSDTKTDPLNSSRFGLLILLIAALLVQGWLVKHLSELTEISWILGRYAIQAAFFVAGTSACIFADKIVLTPVSVSGACLLLALTSWFFGYGWAAPVLVTYIALGAAVFIPAGRFEGMGDWSYGVYIYHYPILQTLGFLGVHPVRAETFFLCALPATAIMAVLSWRYIEAPALRWKTHFA